MVSPIQADPWTALLNSCRLMWNGPVKCFAG
jgi:hypothetical protein